MFENKNISFYKQTSKIPFLTILADCKSCRKADFCSLITKRSSIDNLNNLMNIESRINPRLKKIISEKAILDETSKTEESVTFIKLIANENYKDFLIKAFINECPTHSIQR